MVAPAAAPPGHIPSYVRDPAPMSVTEAGFFTHEYCGFILGDKSTGNKYTQEILYQLGQIKSLLKKIVDRNPQDADEKKESIKDFEETCQDFAFFLNAPFDPKDFNSLADQFRNGFSPGFKALSYASTVRKKQAEQIVADPRKCRDFREQEDSINRIAAFSKQIEVEIRQLETEIFELVRKASQKLNVPLNISSPKVVKPRQVSLLSVLGDVSSFAIKHPIVTLQSLSVLTAAISAFLQTEDGKKILNGLESKWVGFTASATAFLPAAVQACQAGAYEEGGLKLLAALGLAAAPHLLTPGFVPEHQMALAIVAGAAFLAGLVQKPIADEIFASEKPADFLRPVLFGGATIASAALAYNRGWLTAHPGAAVIVAALEAHVYAYLRGENKISLGIHGTAAAGLTAAVAAIWGGYAALAAASLEASAITYNQTKNKKAFGLGSIGLGIALAGHFDIGSVRQTAAAISNVAGFMLGQGLSRSVSLAIEHPALAIPTFMGLALLMDRASQNAKVRETIHQSGTYLQNAWKWLSVENVKKTARHTAQAAQKTWNDLWTEPARVVRSGFDRAQQLSQRVSWNTVFGVPGTACATASLAIGSFLNINNLQYFGLFLGATNATMAILDGFNVFAPPAHRNDINPAQAQVAPENPGANRVDLVDQNNPDRVIQVEVQDVTHEDEEKRPDEVKDPNDNLNGPD